MEQKTHVSYQTPGNTTDILIPEDFELLFPESKATIAPKQKSFDPSVRSKNMSMRTGGSFEQDIVRQQTINHELQKILSKNLMEQTKKDQLVAHLLDTQLKGILQLLIQIIQSSQELQKKVREKQGETELFEFDKFVSIISLGLSENQQKIEFENEFNDDWVWVNTPHEEFLEKFHALLTEIEHFQIKVQLEGKTIAKPTPSSPYIDFDHLYSNGMTCPQFMSIALMKLGTGTLFALKVLYVTYKECIRLATLAGVAAIVLQSPWTGAITVLLKFLLK